MAAQSLRSRRNPRRTHGIHSLPKTLLLRLQRPPSQTMIFSLLFCECRRWFTPSAFREPSLVYAGRFLRGSTRLPCSFSATGHLCLRVLSSLCVLCVNSFFFRRRWNEEDCRGFGPGKRKERKKNSHKGRREMRVRGDRGGPSRKKNRVNGWTLLESARRKPATAREKRSG